MLKMTADAVTYLGQFLNSTYIFLNDLTRCVLVALYYAS